MFSIDRAGIDWAAAEANDRSQLRILSAAQLRSRVAALSPVIPESWLVKREELGSGGIGAVATPMSCVG